MEIWRTLKRVPRYQVSNLGRVRTRSRKRLLALTKNKKGNLTCNLNCGKYATTAQVRRLVGEVWNKSFRPEFRAIHRNGDTTDCSSKNLLWVTVSEKYTGTKRK